MLSANCTTDRNVVLVDEPQCCPLIAAPEDGPECCQPPVRGSGEEIEYLR